MNKKILALIIVAVVVVGAYASYYAYATMVLVPEDLKVLKDELESISNPSFNESEINQMESQASLIEDYNALSLVSQSERNMMAENITNGTGGGKAQLEEIKQNFTTNRDKAQKYDLIFKGDVANDLRKAYDQKVFNLIDQLMANADKQAIDLKNGDSKAYANDIREFARLAREFNAYQTQVKGYLQDAINKLGG